MRKILFARRRIELMLIDTAIVIAMYFIMILFAMYGVSSMEIEGMFSLVKIGTFYIILLIFRNFFGIYNSIWRYANTFTYIKLMLSDMLAAFVYYVVGRFVTNAVFVGFSYTLTLIMLVLLTTLASRFMYQIIYTYAAKFKDNRSFNLLYGDENIHKIKVAIVGAGNVGASLAEELIRNPIAHYEPYCFIDKDVNKIGSGINGIPIYEEDAKIVDKIKSMPVQEIVIAIPEASSDTKMRLYNLYKQTECKVKIYDYPLGDKSDGNSEKARLSLRELRIEDLLFRDTINVSDEKASEFYNDKTILVTGGGGSIGSELCRQISKLSPKHLIILDIYENNAYDIQQELIRKYGNSLKISTIIASVRDLDRMEEVFEEFRPDIVFHAAAHKHVPLMQDSGCEAIKNNVFGTYIVANLSEKYNVKKFLLISTDKAVNPTNIMGASKRLCEMVIQCRKDSKTEFTAVRFGNVLGSNGSVIPLFKRQIDAGGPITLTDKRIIRYFMTIPEAVGLIMEACFMAKNGELYVLDMGKPVKILDLAENMIRLSGYVPYKDIDIVEIGLRPGEKLYEELLMKSEELDKTENELIFIERDKGYSREAVEEKLSILKNALNKSENIEKDRNGHYNAVLDAIRMTVPTYRSPEEVNKDALSSDEMKITDGQK